MVSRRLKHFGAQGLGSFRALADALVGLSTSAHPSHSLLQAGDWGIVICNDSLLVAQGTALIRPIFARLLMNRHSFQSSRSAAATGQRQAQMLGVHPLIQSASLPTSSCKSTRTPSASIDSAPFTSASSHSRRCRFSTSPPIISWSRFLVNQLAPSIERLWYCAMRHIVPTLTSAHQAHEQSFKLP